MDCMAGVCSGEPERRTGDGMAEDRMGVAGREGEWEEGDEEGRDGEEGGKAVEMASGIE